MPTGVTADIYKGEPVTLRQYILRCSRLMMPLVRFRDEPMDMEIPKQVEEERYNYERLEKFQRQWEEHDAMSEEQVEHAYAKAMREEKDERERRSLEAENLRKRYLAMREQVKAWEVPKTLDGLKRIALEQLDSSIQHDCYPMPEDPIPTKDEWFEKARKDILWNVKHYTKQCEKEARNTKFVNEWLAALHESLKEAE